MYFQKEVNGGTVTACSRGVVETVDAIRSPVRNRRLEKLMTKYWKAKDVAESFGVTRRTVFTWVSEGLIPHYKIGRSIFFSRQEAEQQLQRNRFVGEVHCPSL